MRTALRDIVRGDTQNMGEEGGAVFAPPWRRVEAEDNSEAPAALQRGSDQGRSDLRRAEARDRDLVPGDSSGSESSSCEGSSDGSALGGGAVNVVTKRRPSPLLRH